MLLSGNVSYSLFVMASVTAVNQNIQFAQECFYVCECVFFFFFARLRQVHYFLSNSILVLILYSFKFSEIHMHSFVS